MKQNKNGRNKNHITRLQDQSEDLFRKSRQLREEGVCHSEKIKTLKEQSEKLISKARKLIEETRKTKK